MIKHGLSGEEASANFWVVDDRGMISSSRSGIQEHVQVFARVQEEEKQHDGDSLLDVVKRVKPTGVRCSRRCGALNRHAQDRSR